VKRVAYGYTFQGKDGKQVRKTDASWSREDAEKALAAALLNIRGSAATDDRPQTIVSFKAMTERYLKEKEISKKRTIYSLRKTVQRLLAHFGAETPLSAITSPRIAEYRITRLTTKSERKGRPRSGWSAKSRGAYASSATTNAIGFWRSAASRASRFSTPS